MAERVPTVHLQARVPVDLATAIEGMAVSEDRTISQELRRAIRQYVTESENGHPDPVTALQGPMQEAAGERV